ncbi:MAG: hypothetical protein IT204_02735 [Fimbriimonadaceae bacterium]|nr:hypothetical protein [Fimbriimonadaceae bacterium]
MRALGCLLLCSGALWAADNLVPNGGFEEPVAPGGIPPGWAMWGAQEYKIPANFSRDTTQPHRGEACFRVHQPAGGRGYCIIDPAQAIQPLAGQTYTLSLWARSDQPGPLNIGWCAYASLNPYRDAPWPRTWNLALTTAWQRFELPLREGTEFFADVCRHLSVLVRPEPGATVARTCWLDDLSVVATPNPDPFRLINPATLTHTPLTEPLRPGATTVLEVQAGQVVRAVRREVGGVSFHRVSGWTGHPYNRAGEFTLNPAQVSAVAELQLPMTRFYAVGDETYPVEAALDRIDQLCRQLNLPRANVVIELEDQGANRKVEPARWADAVRHSQQRGYGFRWWEVANEPYSSTWGTNHGAAYPSGDAYAAQVVAVSQAVKAVDPQARVGIAISEQTAWGSNVLARAAGHYDFVVAHYYAGFGEAARRKFEAVAVGFNQFIFDRIRRTDALIRAYNPQRPVVQFDTEWGLHMSGPAGSVADGVLRNGNSWGLLHRAVRLIHYAREDLLAGASAWQLLNVSRSPGFGVIAIDRPEPRMLQYFLHQLVNQHLGDEVVALSGTAPFFVPAAGDDPQLPAGQFGGPLTPAVAMLGADGRHLTLIIANASLDRELPIAVNLHDFVPGATQATLLRQADPEASPLLTAPSEVLHPLPVQRTGTALRLSLPSHSVAFVRVERG